MSLITMCEMVKEILKKREKEKMTLQEKKQLCRVIELLFQERTNLKNEIAELRTKIKDSR